MGAIFFYIFIYFIGYYASNILNMLTVQPLITNRYTASLVFVYAIALTHAYVIVNSSPPPHITVEYALLLNIVMPIVVVTLGAVYLMWNSKDKDQVSSETQTSKEDNISDNSKSDHDKDGRKSGETDTTVTIEEKQIISNNTEASSELLVSKDADTSKSKNI